MKITEVEVKTGRVEIGKFRGNTVSLTLTGELSVQMGDTYLYRTKETVERMNADRVANKLDPLIPDYVSKDDCVALADHIIARMEAWKKSL